jgi:hypothetical protein
MVFGAADGRTLTDAFDNRLRMDNIIQNVQNMQNVYVGLRNPK